MDAKEVVDKILAEAQAEADKILADAQAAADETLKHVATEVDDYKDQTQTLADNACAERQSQIMASARMELSKAQLAAKVELLDDVFTSAAEKINTMPDDDYKDFITALIKKSVENGDEKVIIGKNETRIDHDFIKNVNRQMGPGFKGNIQLAEERANITGGFILKRGDIQINVSTDVMIDRVKDDLQMKLAQELFQ